MDVRVIGVGSLGRRMVESLARERKFRAQFVVVDYEDSWCCMTLTPEELKDVVPELLSADRVFVLGALGGSTGTRAVEIIIEHPAASSPRVEFYLVLPFVAESLRRSRAESLVARMKELGVTVHLFDNERLLRLNGHTTLHRAITIFPMRIQEAMYNFFRLSKETLEYGGLRLRDLDRELRLLEGVPVR